MASSDSDSESKLATKQEEVVEETVEGEVVEDVVAVDQAETKQEDAPGEVVVEGEGTETETEEETETEKEDAKKDDVAFLTKDIGFSNFNLQEAMKLNVPEFNINDTIKQLLIDGNDSLVNKIKNDAIFKNVFKSENREAEAIEDIKSKYKEFEETTDFYIVDLIEYLNELKNFIKKSNNDTKSIDDFIDNFCNELDKSIEKSKISEIKLTDEQEKRLFHKVG